MEKVSVMEGYDIDIRLVPYLPADKLIRFDKNILKKVDDRLSE